MSESCVGSEVNTDKSLGGEFSCTDDLLEGSSIEDDLETLLGNELRSLSLSPSSG